MPTNEWFQENPKISAYISKELYQHLEMWMESQGVKKISQALTQILEEYLGVVQSIPNQPTVDLARLEILEGKVENLSQEMREMREATLMQQSSSKVTQSREFSKLAQSRKFEQIPAQPTSLTSSGGQLLTTGETYEILKGKGFSKSIGTFRRTLADALQTGVLPESITQYGLSANFEIRRTANPKDSSVRWLHFD